MQSTFHHFADYNWDTRAGSRSIVDEPLGAAIMRTPPAIAARTSAQVLELMRVLHNVCAAYPCGSPRETWAVAVSRDIRWDSTFAATRPTPREGLQACVLGSSEGLLVNHPHPGPLALQVDAWVSGLRRLLQGAMGASGQHLIPHGCGSLRLGLAARNRTPYRRRPKPVQNTKEIGGVKHYGARLFKGVSFEIVRLGEKLLLPPGDMVFALRANVPPATAIL